MQRDGKKKNYVMLCLLFFSLAVTLIDALVHPPYFPKIAVKIVFFLALPLLFFGRVFLPRVWLYDAAAALFGCGGVAFQPRFVRRVSHGDALGNVPSGNDRAADARPCCGRIDFQRPVRSL